MTPATETDGSPISSELEGAIHRANEQVEALASLTMGHDELREIMESSDGPDQERAEVWGCLYGFEMMAERLERVVEDVYAGELDRAAVEGELMEVGAVLHALAATVERWTGDNPADGDGLRFFARDTATKVRSLWGKHHDG